MRRLGKCGASHSSHRDGLASPCLASPFLALPCGGWGRVEMVGRRTTTIFVRRKREKIRVEMGVEVGRSVALRCGVFCVCWVCLLHVISHFSNNHVR